MAKKILLTAVWLAVVALPGGRVWADVAAIVYTDPGGQAQTVAPSKQYINPAGAVSLYLTAGLDRKVGYVLTDAAGQVVAEGVSDLLTPSDTLTVLGNTYYGKVLTVPSTLSEGRYTLKALILTGGGAEVSRQSVPLVVDRTGPAAGDMYRHWGDVITDNKLYGFHNFLNAIVVKNVSDLSGIAAVQFESYDPNTGAAYFSKPAWYDEAQNTVGVGKGTYFSITLGQYIPAMDGLLGLRFILCDKAGNTTVVSRTIRWNGTNEPVPQLVAIYNPNVTTEFIPGSGLVGFVPYTPGMQTYANPVHLLYALKRSNWKTENPDYGLYPAGVAPSNGSVVFMDAEYVYCLFKVPFYNPFPATHEVCFASHDASPYYVTYSLSLAETAPKSPVLISQELNRDDIGWDGPVNGRSLIKEYTTPVNVSKIRCVVEPRPYTQKYFLRELPGASCIIAPGETGCEAQVNWTVTPGTMAQRSVYTQIQNEDATLKTIMGSVHLFYDMIPPSITSYTMDREAKTLAIHAVDQQTDYSIGSGHPSGIDSGWVIVRNNVTAQEVKLNGTVTRLTGDNHRIDVSYASLPEGDYDFTLWVKDRYFGNTGNLSIGQVLLDRTPPVVEIRQDGAPAAAHGQTDSLGRLTFTVSDNVDPAPALEEVRISGGPHGININLPVHVQDGAYVLEYPLMFPSSLNNSEYTLTVKARDAAGNQRIAALPFSYAPPQVTLQTGGNTAVALPAMPAAPVHTDGSNALISEPVRLNGAPLAGVYDLTVVSSSTSTVPVTVADVTVAPGESVSLSSYNFGASGGRLNLPVWSDQAGRADLLITSWAPNFPNLVAPLKFWKPQVQLTASPGWAVQPLVETQQVAAQALGATPCQITLDEQEAREADPIDDPKCLVEFPVKPRTYQVRGGFLTGTLGPDDALGLDYQVSVYSGGVKYIMGSGSQALNRKPLTAVSVGVAASPGRQVFRKVQFLQLTAQADGPVPCRVTDNELEARRWGATELACLVSWTTRPEGLGQARLKNLPALQGYLEQNSTLAWTVDLYGPAGVMAGVSSRSLNLTAVDPPAPEFAIHPGMYSQQIGEQVFATSDLAGGQFGQAVMGSALADVKMTMELSGLPTGVLSRQYTVGGGSISRTLTAGPLQVWEQRQITARAYYSDIPGLETVRQATVVGVPSAQIQLRLLSASQALTSSGVGVRLELGQPGRSGLMYDESRDGSWRVRLGRLDAKNQWQAVTEWQPLPESGAWETAVPVSDPAYVKLQAVAELIPPSGLSSFNRVLNSNRVYVLVLKGEAPEGQLIGRKITGPAPLTAILSLQAGTVDRQILGAIDWQMSDANGATWSEIPGARGSQAAVKVNAGTYLVRARLENKKSGAAGYTETVQLHAYDLPRLAVDAPAAVLVGTPLTLAARYFVGVNELPASAVAVEWLDKDGQVLGTGPNLSLTPGEIAALVYQVRARPASPDIDAAELRQTVRVRVVPPQPPGVTITGPAYLMYSDKNTPAYQFLATVAPSPGMNAEAVESQWELPDGRTVPGLALAYSPTEEDVANRRALLKFTAWIAGYKEKTVRMVNRAVVVSEYAWPDFSVEAKSRLAMAPTLLTLTAMPSTRQPWKLEEPAYSWRLPGSFQVLSRKDRGRVVEVYCPDPGSYDVAVEVQDARGSVAEAAAAVELAEPPPLKVNFAPIYSNAEQREPLNVLLRPRAFGGHPHDALVKYTYEVDDPRAVVVGSGSSGIITGLTAGDRTVRLIGQSRFNKAVEASFPISVLANQPPACTVTSSRDARYVYLQAECSDPDGKITAYRWYRNGRVISSTNRVQLTINDCMEALLFEALDNGGARYRETITYNTGG